MTQPLYPDQMVFLTDTFYLDQEMLEAGQAVASSKTGELLMQMDAKKALTLTETLTAVFFVMEHIRKAGYELSTMGEAAKKFIVNWESEKYRKSLAGKKGLRHIVSRSFNIHKQHRGGSGWNRLCVFYRSILVFQCPDW